MWLSVHVFFLIEFLHTFAIWCLRLLEITFLALHSFALVPLAFVFMLLWNSLVLCFCFFFFFVYCCAPVFSSEIFSFSIFFPLLQEAAVIVKPDCIIWGHMHSTTSQLTFSSRSIKLEGSTLFGTKRSFHFNWSINDLVKISSLWCREVSCKWPSIKCSFAFCKSGIKNQKVLSCLSQLFFFFKFRLKLLYWTSI